MADPPPWMSMAESEGAWYPDQDCKVAYLQLEAAGAPARHRLLMNMLLLYPSEYSMDERDPDMMDFYLEKTPTLRSAFRSSRHHILSAWSQHRHQHSTSMQMWEYGRADAHRRAPKPSPSTCLSLRTATNRRSYPARRHRPCTAHRDRLRHACSAVPRRPSRACSSSL